MNRVYYNEFKGLDGILNRVEILSEVSGIEEYVKTGKSPFVLRYADVMKLDPVHTAQGYILSVNMIFSLFHFILMICKDIELIFIGEEFCFGQDGWIQNYTTRYYLNPHLMK